MRFSPVPEESRGQIDKAGRTLIDLGASPDERNWAIELAERWRACHAYPINTFQATLRSKTKPYGGDPIVAQRLKRMTTIEEKLRRLNTMELSRMQDIAGVRAIMTNPKDVMRVVDEYKNNSRFYHELSKVKDYISCPRDKDGYRSIHLVYKYKGQKTDAYDGLRLEMQFRTKLQHIWATAVETMGMVTGQRLKSSEGDQKWIDFFAIASSAFAYQESAPLVPKISHLTRKQTTEELVRAEKAIDALNVMRGVSVATETILKKRRSFAFYLLTLDMETRRVAIQGYAQENFALAEQDYTAAEKRAAEGENLQSVLVSAGSMERLRRAYPNFFLNIKDFESKVRKIIQSNR